jgi:methyltransferase (TIGR00027 family)
MKKGRASRTAEGAAAARALHRFGVPNPLFDDPYALRFTSPAWRMLMSVPGLGNWVNGSLMRSLRPVQAQVLVRSRYAEDQLAAALAQVGAAQNGRGHDGRGAQQDAYPAGRSAIGQYVIVGAGFDSFALRRTEWAKTLRIYELDHPDTQLAKRQRLHKVSRELPQNLEFVPVDFERETVAAALQRSSFDSASPAFFSWLGTTPYLSNAATLATLQAIAEIAAPGSQLVFDYMIPQALLHGEQLEMMQTLRGYTERRNEPLCGDIDPQRLRAAVQAMGFEWLEELDGHQQYERYFAARQDDLVPMHATHLVHLRRC